MFSLWNIESKTQNWWFKDLNQTRKSRSSDPCLLDPMMITNPKLAPKSLEALKGVLCDGWRWVYKSSMIQKNYKKKKKLFSMSILKLVVIPLQCFFFFVFISVLRQIAWRYSRESLRGWELNQIWDFWEFVYLVWKIDVGCWNYNWSRFTDPSTDPTLHILLQYCKSVSIIPISKRIGA